MKRSGLKRPTLAQVIAWDERQRARRQPILRSARVKVESDRHRALRPARDAVVDAVRARDRNCQAAARCAPGTCAGRLDVHEIIQRSVWAGGYLVVENCLLVCRAHHDWIDTDLTLDGEPRRLGLHAESWERAIVLARASRPEESYR